MTEANDERLRHCLGELEAALARLRSMATETLRQVSDEELRSEADRRGYVLNSRQFWEVAAQAIRFKDAVESSAKHRSRATSESAG